MKEKSKPMLFILAGICFLVSAVIGKNYVFIPIGCCFIILGIVHSKDKSDSDKKGDK